MTELPKTLADCMLANEFIWGGRSRYGNGISRNEFFGESNRSAVVWAKSPNFRFDDWSFSCTVRDAKDLHCESGDLSEEGLVDWLAGGKP